MKLEKRGKYAGVKVHLDGDECESLISPSSSDSKELDFVSRLRGKIKELLAKEPDLLKDRTDEEIAAILAKESEKAALQLERLKNGKNWKKVDPARLQDALMKHVK